MTERKGWIKEKDKAGRGVGLIQIDEGGYNGGGEGRRKCAQKNY